MDTRAENALELIKQLSIRTFGEGLTGVYVHGSLAFGCFSWDNSDIDFITVLSRRPTPYEKEAYISGLLEISELCPPKGLEMSAVLERYARRFVYPTPYELHFSKLHLTRCAENLSAYCRDMHGTDRDLAAHFTVIRRACITLCGEPAESVFGDVPAADYFDSIKRDVVEAAAAIADDPAYAVLNLCRALAYKREGLVLSKRDGGAWGAAHLDGRFSAIVTNASEAYGGSHPAAIASKDELTAFAKHMLALILAD